MRKYVSTDNSGRTSSGVIVAAGRTVNRDGTVDLFQQISPDCYDSPEAAALLGPADGDGDSYRLFTVDRWGASGDAADARGYTVIREVDRVPALTLMQRVTLAVAAIAQLYSQRDYRHWATAWIDGSDRTAESAARMQRSLNEELGAAQQLGSIGGLAMVSHSASGADAGQRALQVARAAEGAATPGTDENTVIALLASATAGLGGTPVEQGIAPLARELVGRA